MWHSSTANLIEKDPAKKQAGEWKAISEGYIFFMWVDKIIDSQGVTKQAGVSYEIKET